MNTQNTFTQNEQTAAEQLAGTVGQAIWHAMQYAAPADLQAATVALLVRALIVAGGTAFLKPQTGE